MEMDTNTKKRKKDNGVKAKMEYVPTKDGKGCPYVAFFPSRFDPLKASEENAEISSAEFAAYRNPKPLSRQQELVAYTSEDVDFVGDNFVGEAAGWQPCNYLLGVFDKEKKSLKLMPLAGDKVFRMEPRVRGFEYGRPAEEEDEDENQSTPEIHNMRKKMLTDAFGSQRSRLRAARRERGIIKEDDLADMKGTMENLFKEAADNETMFTTAEAMDQANSVAIRNIPPYDLNAKSPQAAYPLTKIITEEEWECMDVTDLQAAAKYTKSEVQALLDEKAYPEFVLSRVKRLRVEGDKGGSDRRAHILMYIKYLLAFHNAGHAMIAKAADSWRRGGVSDPKGLGIPGVIITKFLNIFTTKGSESGSEQRPKRNKEHGDLLISYVLVLGLMVDDYQADPVDLARELKLTLSKLRPYYEELGCKVVAVKAQERNESQVSDNLPQKKWKVTLPIPLHFPELRRPVQKTAGRGGRR